MSAELDKRYYTEKEFCEMMEITRKTALKWRKDRIIGYTQSPNGTFWYRKSDIEEYERRYGVRPRRAA
jgi:predicted site-specific integrase-resolvase